MRLNIANICCLSVAVAGFGLQAVAEETQTESLLPESFVRQAGQLEEAVSFFREDRERMKKELDELRQALQSARDEATQHLEQPTTSAPAQDDQYRKEAENLADRCAALENEIKEQRVQLEGLKKQNQELLDQVAQAKTASGAQDQMPQRLLQAEKERDQLMALLESSQQAGRQLDADVIRLASERDALRQQVEQEAKAATRQFTEWSERAKNEMAALKDRLEEERLSRTTSDDNLRQLAAELSGERGRSADLARKLNKAQDEKEQLKQLADRLAEEKATLSASLEARPVSVVEEAPVPEEEEAIAGTPFSPREINAQAAKARRLLSEGRTEEARALYLACLNAQPGHAMARLGLANCYYQAGELTKAEAEATELAKMGNQPYACGLLGLVMMQQGRCSEAAKIMREAIKLEPRCPRLRNYYGVALQNDQRPNEAIGQFRQALRLDDAFGEAHYNLAVLLATTPPENLEEARKHYQTALNLGRPKNEELETIFSL